MSLQPGDSLGPYTVTAKIGEGGMGEVYRARDTKLDRDVALKVLPEAFTQDPDRLARFEREAKVLASLNHPNIAAIYGLEEADDTRALVLELVEGPTLADRIKRGPIPLDEALPIAKQIAEALEAAHEAGVIHRDLKPANIKVREDGTVKVLDFGLAKALDPTSEGDPSQSPTLTAAATQMGVIMGTAAYMSPEQARGSVVDRRADIWAFGVVLYEMLTGRRPFEGSDVSEVMAGVIKSEPEWDALPEDLPLGLNGYLRRCLHKEPKQRLQAVGDMRLAMEGAFESPRSSSSIGRAIRPADSPRFRWLMIGISGVLAAVTGLTVWTLKPSPQSPVNLMRFAIATSESAALRISPNTPDLAFSPNGTNVIYSGPGVGGTGSQLFLRPLDQVTGVPLRGTEGAISPFISPDGQWVGFATGSGTTVRKVPIFGGPPETVATLPVALRGASWGQDDQIIMGTTTGGLFLVSGQGGQPEALTTPDSGENHRWPYALPDHNAVVFMIGNNLAGGQLAALALETRQVTPLGLAGTSPYFDSTGHLVYTAADGSVRAAPFDPDRLVITGDPVQLIDGVVAKTSGAANLSISRNGRLVYVAAVAGGPQRTLVWVDRDGSEERLAAPPRAYNYPRISPDDSQIALDIRDQDNDRVKPIPS